MSRKQITAFLLASSMLSPLAAQAQMAPTLGFYGDSAGLIEMPTADMLPDAELGVVYSEFADATNVGVSFQFTDQLSMSYRIQRLENFGASGSVYDGIWDVNYQILKEGTYLPAVKIGFRDFLATGRTASQYVVATKTIADQLKVTAGVGWGRLGDTDEVQTDSSESGGSLRLDEYFTGPSAVFGGIEWQTPIKGVSFKAEYSTDSYVQENTLNPPASFDRKSDWNYGIDWQTPLNVNVGLYYMYGSEVGIRFATSLNPKRSRPQGYIIPAPIPIQAREQKKRTDLSWLDRPNVETVARDVLTKTLSADWISVRKIRLTSKQADVVVTGGRPTASAQTFGRVARAMTQFMPESIDTFTITIENSGMATSKMTIDRDDFIRFELDPNGIRESARTFELSDAQTEYDDFKAFPPKFPRFAWSIRPYFSVTLFSSGDQPSLNAGLSGNANYRLSEKSRFDLGLRLPIIDGETQSNPNSVGPDDSAFFVQAELALTRLSYQYIDKLGDNLYGKFDAGVLNSKWVGVAGEILWKPADQRWGLGLDLNYVKQRDEDEFLDLIDYEIATGHVSYYYSTRNGFDFEINAGRYLAGDWGATFAVDRTFDNGWVVGLFATLTDQTAEEFGPGRFQKGFRVAIPLGWAIGTQTRRTIGSTIASTSGDGGSRLSVPGNLYRTVSGYHVDSVSGTWGAFYK
ncbi:MAG: YjbH domain-containing protein [Pseudomonadota bacterium]